MASILVLWDIDQTLIEARGAGLGIYADAFGKATGCPLHTMPRLAGLTERVIFREALKIHGIDETHDLFDRFAAELARGYSDRADEVRGLGRSLPGAEAALRALAARNDVVQSVLTGNTRNVAAVKLRTFGLDRYLDLDIGAYGTDDDVRANLVKIARQRVEAARGLRFDPATTILIGDTEHDVTAALDGGARIIAVATGSYTAAALTAAGADTVLDDLTQTADLVTTICGDLKRPHG